MQHLDPIQFASPGITLPFEAPFLLREYEPSQEGYEDDIFSTNVDARKRSEMLQGWLWFGAIRAVMKIWDISISKDQLLGDFVRREHSTEKENSVGDLKATSTFHPQEVGAGEVRLDASANRSVINTIRLQAYLSACILKERQHNPYCLAPDHAGSLTIKKRDYKESFKLGVQGRATQAREILELMYSVLDRLQQQDLPILDAVWDSIIVLGLTLRNAIEAIFRSYKENFKDRLIRFERLGCRCMKQTFHSSEWCPAEANNIKRVVGGDICTLLLCAQIDRSAQKSRHHRCRDTQCTAYTVDEATYKTRHTSACHDSLCKSVEPRILTTAIGSKDKYTALSQQMATIPMVSYSGGEVTMINVTPSGHGLGVRLFNTIVRPGLIRYVAISHVWVDGLGSPRANELPMCQIREIQTLVNKMYSVDCHPVPFWVDTLCIPLEEAARNEAIGNMEWVYKSADRVLVLDNSLRSVESAGTSVEERAVRILCSPWNSRLWTLQEGAMQDKVWYQFSDEAQQPQYDLKNPGENEDLHFRSRDLLLPNDHFLEHILSARFEISESTSLFGIHEYFGDDAQYALSPVWGSLKSCFDGLSSAPSCLYDGVPFVMSNLMYRSCSRPADESLVLASMVRSRNISQKQLALVHPDERYRAYFKSIRSIPQGVLFLDQERYEEYGSRWIPRSLLHKDLQLPPALIEESGIGHLGADAVRAGFPYSDKSAEGLELRAPGFDLNPRKRVDLLPQTFYVRLGGAEYTATLRAPGKAGPFQGELRDDLILLTQFSIWTKPTSCVGAIVTELSRHWINLKSLKPSMFTGTKARFEASVSLRLDSYSLGDKVQREETPNDQIPFIETVENDFMAHEAEMSRLKVPHARWRVG